MELFAFLISLGATTAGAISGIGGAAIITPVWDAVSGLTVSTISFLSGCTVLAMSVVSLLRNTGAKIDRASSTPLALGAALGGLLGKWVFDLVRAGFPAGVVGVVQSTLLLLMLLAVFLFMKGKGKIPTYQVKNLAVTALAGLSLGMLSAFLGIGGGPLNIALLAFLFSMDSKTCAATSISIILFSQTASFLSTLLGGRVPEFSPVMLGLMIAGGVGGGFLGSALVKKMDNAKVDRFFTWMLAFLAVISGWNLWRFLGMV